MLSNFFGSKQNKETQMSSEGKGKVLAILNQKGGVGKTTMAFHLAHALARSGAKVLALDFDPQANLTLLFGKTPQNLKGNIFHLLINSLRELKALHTPLLTTELIVKGQEGVDLLPSGQELSGFELSVAGIQAPRQLILKNYLDRSGLREMYDYIVIDGPPTLGLLMVNILCAGHGVMVPFQADQFSRAGLENFHQVLQDVEDMGIVKAPKVIGYIPNLVETRRRQGQLDFGKIKEDLRGGARVFDPFANRAQLSRLGALGKSIFSYEGKEYLGLQEQFQSMAQEVIKELT